MQLSFNNITLLTSSRDDLCALKKAQRFSREMPFISYFTTEPIWQKAKSVSRFQEKEKSRELITINDNIK
jgi:hypothetical protein